MKRSFLPGNSPCRDYCMDCTTWTLTKQLEKKLDGKLHKECCEQYWTSPGGNTPQGTNYTATCPPIMKTIQVRWTRHAGHCWRSRDELISDVLLWTPTYGRAKAGWPARTYRQQLCEDMGCSSEELPEAVNDREKWRERVQGYPCKWHDMMMMIIIAANVFLS